MNTLQGWVWVDDMYVGKIEEVTEKGIFFSEYYLMPFSQNDMMGALRLARTDWEPDEKYEETCLSTPAFRTLHSIRHILLIPEWEKIKEALTYR